MFISHVSDQLLIDTDAHYQLVLLQKRPICALWGSSLRSKQAWWRHEMNLQSRCCTLHLTEWKGSFHMEEKCPWSGRCACSIMGILCLQLRTFPWDFWLIIMSLSFRLPCSPGIFSVGQITLHLHKYHTTFFFFLYWDIWYFGKSAMWQTRAWEADLLRFHAWHHRVCL